MIATLLVLAALLTPAPAQLQPRAHITGGPSGEVAETTATFSFEADGPAPLTSFECRLDAGPWKACESPAEYGDLGGGPHSFEVRLTGAVADSRPDRREWTVTQRTEVVPPRPNPVVEPPATVTPPAPRPSRRRDASGCAFGANQPGEVSPRRLRGAILCLVNVRRRARGLVRVHHNARLQRSASRHVRDMLARRYFEHDTPGGTTAADRARSAGYLRGARYWTIGEVIAWLIRPRPTAAAVVRAWMKSTPHRHVLLRPSFRDAGVGLARGNPRVRGGAGATFAIEFGRRD